MKAGFAFGFAWGIVLCYVLALIAAVIGSKTWGSQEGLARARDRL